MQGVTRIIYSVAALSLLKFSSDFPPMGLGAIVSCFPGFRLWIQEKTPTVTILSRTPWWCYKPAETSANPPSTTGSCLQPLPLHGSAIRKATAPGAAALHKPFVADKMFQEQTRAPGRRAIASPKGVSKFIQLNYVPLVGAGNTRRGIKTLQGTIMELVRSNMASTQAPFKGRKCHQ